MELVRGSDNHLILDHITSRHSEYVLARFRMIRPGENWTAIRHMMSNYSQKDSTHSNIYRRLEWNRPSVTLGHYRKSMLIHPGQDRGLSLREAMRLQSFPDWYRLMGPRGKLGNWPRSETTAACQRGATNSRQGDR